MNTDTTDFVNALREVLGLGPLPFTAESAKEAREPDRSIMARTMRYTGDGCTHHNGYLSGRQRI